MGSAAPDHHAELTICLNRYVGRREILRFTGDARGEPEAFSTICIVEW